MADIPIGIRDFELSQLSDKELSADFSYRTRTFAVQSRRECVHFQKPYPFKLILGEGFDEHEIRRWTVAHNGLWDPAWFLTDKIKERGGSAV